jgi:acyl-CoA thioesterase
MQMDETTRTRLIADHIQDDAFARFLGATVEIIKPGHSRASLTVTGDMTNFNGTTHGGVIFAIGDLAFAAACNSHGRVAVALNVSIVFIKPSRVGDRLVAEATEVHAGRQTSLYDIIIYKQDTGELIARSQDQAYRMNQWIVPEQ